MSERPEIINIVAGKGLRSSARKRIAVDVFAAFGRRPKLLDLFCCANRFDLHIIAINDSRI